MTPDEIVALAEALANESFLTDWRFFLLLFSISTLGGLLGSYLRSYGSEKGRFKAIEENIDSINKNLAITTSTTERIRGEIEDEFWQRRDRESLKRQKLESYITAINRANQALHDQMNNAFFYSNRECDDSAWNEADMLQALYLPELSIAHNEFRKALANFQIWLSEGMQLVLDQRRSGVQYATPGEQHMAQYQELRVAFHQPMRNIMRVASEIAEAINS